MSIRIQAEPNTARSILGVLLAIEIAFALVYIAETALGSPSHLLHELMNLDGEDTVPTWFSTVQLSVIGLIFLHFAMNVPALREYRRCFLLFFVGFVFLSVDENISIHERITYRLHDIDWLPRFQGNHGVWIAVYLVIAAIFILVNLKPMLDLLKQYPRNVRMFAAGSAVFVTGAVFMEIIGYMIVGDGTPGLTYHLEVTLEEFLEMAGASIMMYSIIASGNAEHPPPS